MPTTLTLILSYSSNATREAGAVAAFTEEITNECFQAGTCVICEKSLEYVMACMHCVQIPGPMFYCRVLAIMIELLTRF